jgi:hypothetical protein
VADFLQQHLLSPEPPLLGNPPLQGQDGLDLQVDKVQPQEDEELQPPRERRAECQASKRLADKPTAKLNSIARCQVVLMKKLDILPECEQPEEEHKKRLLGLFNEPLPPLAVSAVEDRLADGAAPMAA